MAAYKTPHRGILALVCLVIGVLLTLVQVARGVGGGGVAPSSWLPTTKGRATSKSQISRASSSSTSTSGITKSKMLSSSFWGVRGGAGKSNDTRYVQ